MLYHKNVRCTLAFETIWILVKSINELVICTGLLHVAVTYAYLFISHYLHF